jgi:hypothetical protein
MHAPSVHASMDSAAVLYCNARTAFLGCLVWYGNEANDAACMSSRGVAAVLYCTVLDYTVVYCTVLPLVCTSMHSLYSAVCSYR